MNAAVVVPKGINEGIHLGRCHEVAIEKNVLDVEEDAEFFRIEEKFANGFARTLVADIVGDRFVIVTPGNRDRSRDNENVFDTEIVSCLRDQTSQFEAPRPFRRVVARERQGTEEETAAAR